MVYDEILYLVRRYTLEKAYGVVAFEIEDGEPILRNLNKRQFGYDLPTIHLNELRPLNSYCDVILARCRSERLEVIALRKSGPRSGFEDLNRDQLDKIGQSCRKYVIEMSEGLSDDDIPHVNIELIDIYSRSLGSVETDHLEYLADISGRREVTVIAHAVGYNTGEVVSYGPLGRIERAWYLKKVLRRTDETEKEMIEAIEEAGVSRSHVITGVLSGLGTALGFRYLLTWLSVEGGEFYFYTDYLGMSATVFTSVLARRIRVNSTLQSVVSVILYVVFLYGIISYFSIGSSIWMVLNGAILVLISVVIGNMAEME